MKRFNLWLSRAGVCILGLLFAGSFFVPPALASNMCMCFCGDQELGAFKAGSFDSSNTCAQTCADADVTFVGCYADESQYPENSNLCWTQDECAKYPIDIAGETFYGSWGGQSPYCSKQSVTDAQMGYCYGHLIPVTLNVPIMGVTQISVLGDYINLLYTYAIPLVGVVGVLMFTIAGFQYMTAGGDKGAVSKAKARMSNTAIGIVLLMSVYAIAYLIDPRLTRFNELRPPLVKKAVMIDDATSCEALFGYGFCISGGCKKDGDTISGNCGVKGEITGDDDVDLNIANPPKVGDACLFSGCNDDSKSCVLKGDKSGGTCVSCDDISSVREATPGLAIGLTPSDAVCSQIASQAQSKARNKNQIYSCYYDNDFGPFADNVAGVDECVMFYTGAHDYIDCAVLQYEASTVNDGCEAYGQMEADSYGIVPSDFSSFIFATGSADGDEDFKSQFESICKADVCGLAGRGKVAQGSCSVVDSETYEEVIRTYLSIFGLSSALPRYSCMGAVERGE